LEFIQTHPSVLFDGIDCAKQQFFEKKYKKLHQEQLLHVHSELLNRMLHPDNYGKLHDWGHLANEY